MCSFISLLCCGRMICSTPNRFSFSTIQVKFWEQSYSKNIVYCTKNTLFWTHMSVIIIVNSIWIPFVGEKWWKWHTFFASIHILSPKKKKIRNHFSVTKYKMRLRTMTCLLYILDLFHRCKVACFCHCSTLTIAPYAHRIPKVRRNMNE